MAEAFEVRINTRRIQVRLEAMPDDLRAELISVEEALVDVMVGRAKALAPVKSGYLAAHIKGNVRSSKRRITARVRAHAPYAAVQEFGGLLEGRVIMPDTRQALSFMEGSEQIFAKSVWHPAYRVPKHPYLYEVKQEMTPEITEKMTGAVKNALHRNENP